MSFSSISFLFLAILNTFVFASPVMDSSLTGSPKASLWDHPAQKCSAIEPIENAITMCMIQFLGNLTQCSCTDENILNLKKAGKECGEDNESLVWMKSRLVVAGCELSRSR